MLFAASREPNGRSVAPALEIDLNITYCRASDGIYLPRARQMSKKIIVSHGFFSLTPYVFKESLPARDR